MSSVNRVILIGHVGKDPEIRTKGEERIASFSLATSKKVNNDKITNWHRVVVYNDGLAKVVEDYVKKGSNVYVEGELGNRTYTDKKGAEQRITEIVLTKFGSKLVLLDKREGKPTSEAGYGTKSTEDKPDFNDEIPF